MWVKLQILTGNTLKLLSNNINCKCQLNKQLPLQLYTSEQADTRVSSVFTHWRICWQPAAHAVRVNQDLKLQLNKRACVERQMEFNMCMTAAPDLNHDILIYPITSAVCYLALLLTISKKCVVLIIKTLLDSSVHYLLCAFLWVINNYNCQLIKPSYQFYGIIWPILFSYSL